MTDAFRAAHGIAPNAQPHLSAGGDSAGWVPVDLVLITCGTCQGAKTVDTDEERALREACPVCRANKEAGYTIQLHGPGDHPGWMWATQTPCHNCYRDIDGNPSGYQIFFTDPDLPT